MLQNTLGYVELVSQVTRGKESERFPVGFLEAHDSARVSSAIYFSRVLRPAGQAVRSAPSYNFDLGFVEANQPNSSLSQSRVVRPARRQAMPR
jgi:hypothetical protein